MKSINLMKNVGRFPPPKSPSPIYPRIVCTIYPPRNCQVRFTLKSSVRFTPPKSPSPDLPSNRLYDPLKSRSPIYPQMIYPPEITKSNLPSNRLYDLPTNRLYDLPSNHLYDLPPFPPKLPSPIYPQIFCTIYPHPPPPQITKSALPSKSV